MLLYELFINHLMRHWIKKLDAQHPLIAVEPYLRCSNQIANLLVQLHLRKPLDTLGIPVKWILDDSAKRDIIVRKRNVPNASVPFIRIDDPLAYFDIIRLQLSDAIIVKVHLLDQQAPH